MKFRRRKEERKARRRPINVLASVMTTMNLYCGVMSIFASIGLEFQNAAYWILAGMIFDMLDGFVARQTNSVTEFGKELDSLCDLATFGMAPAVMVFVAYLPGGGDQIGPAPAQSIVGLTGSYIAIIYVICAALRLARFNTFQADRRDVFVGLPSPAAAGTVAAFMLFVHYYEPPIESTLYDTLAYYTLGPLAVLLALLMVSTIHYPKRIITAFVVSPRHAFQALGFFAFGVALLHYAFTRSPAIVLFPLAITYVLYGLAGAGYRQAARPRRRTEEAEAQEEDSPGGALKKEDSL